MFIPPKTVNVIGTTGFCHGGFCAVTSGKNIGENNTLWRPGHVLKKSSIGTLIEGSVKSPTFFQQNNDCTSARYKVPGYRYPVMVWWDNATGNRVA